MTDDDISLDELRTFPGSKPIQIKPVADYASTDSFVPIYQGVIGGTDNISCYFVESGNTNGFDYQVRTFWNTLVDTFPTSGYFLEASGNVAAGGQYAHTPLRKIGLIQVLVKSTTPGSSATVQAGLVAG